MSKKAANGARKATEKAAEKANEAVQAQAIEAAGLFDQAFRAFGDSFKVVMKVQEDTVKFWSETVGKVNPMNAVAGDLIPMAQRNAEEYIRLIETSYRRNAELVKKMIHGQNTSDAAGLEKRTTDWLEASIDVARHNAQDLASTNLRVAEAWTEAIKKGTQQGARIAQQSAQQGVHFAQQSAQAVQQSAQAAQRRVAVVK